MVITLLAAVLAVVESPATAVQEAQAGDLHIIQGWSTDAGGFRASWDRGTAPLVVSNEVDYAQPITLFVLVKGCRANADGKCNVTGILTFSDPKGAPYGKPIGLPIWSETALRTANQYVLSPSGVTMQFGREDRIGSYTAHLSVTDAAANATATSHYNIALRPNTKPMTR